MNRLRRWWPALVVVLIVLIVSPVLVDRWQVAAVRTRATEIAVGDSAGRVREVLGKPAAVFPRVRLGPKGDNFVEIWCYGSVFDWDHVVHAEFPFIYPFRLRLFGPDRDDVAVLFDGRKTVVRVDIP